MVFLIATVGCTDTDEVLRRTADDIVYLLPAETPEGWAVAVATERATPVPDYMVSWRPMAAAGRNRSEAKLESGPGIWINVEAKAYGRAYALNGPSDVDDATIRLEAETLNLEFVASGSPVSVGSQGVTEDELRRFAKSLRQHTHDDLAQEARRSVGLSARRWSIVDLSPWR